MSTIPATGPYEFVRSDEAKLCKVIRSAEGIVRCYVDHPDGWKLIPSGDLPAKGPLRDVFAHLKGKTRVELML